MLSRSNICTEITMYRNWPSKYTHVHVYIISKRYWGETILSPQNPGEYWGERPCCPCAVGAYARRPKGTIVAIIIIIIIKLSFIARLSKNNLAQKRVTEQEKPIKTEFL